MADFKKYICDVCDHVYDEAEGDEESGIAPGTLWADIPDDWRCPDCKVGKEDFSLLV
jgi:rubredoxin